MFTFLFFYFLSLLIVSTICFFILSKQEEQEQKLCNHSWVMVEEIVIPSYSLCTKCRTKERNPSD